MDLDKMLRVDRCRDMDELISYLKTSNIRIVQLCQELFHFELPSVQLARRRKLFLDKFCVCVYMLISYVFLLFFCFLSSTMLLVNKDLH